MKIMTMHNGKWTSADDLSAEFIVAHAEFIITSHSVEKGSRRPSSLSVTTQNEPNVSKARVVSTWQM